MEKIDSKIQRRQVELLKKRFDVDEEKKIVELDLHYDQADEILDKNIDSKVPTFNREKFALLDEIMSDFPREYKVNLNIKIDDYQDYKSSELMEGFNDAVELTQYSGTRGHRKKWMQIIFLLIAGIMILNILARGVIGNWLQLEDETKDVVREVFDITSWVFIWQAVSLMFLTPTFERRISLSMAFRVNEVCFIDKDDKVLIKENYHDTYNTVIRERKTRTFGRYALLISGAAFFALAISTILNTIFSIPGMINDAQADNPDYTGLLYVAAIIIIVLSLVVSVFEGLGGAAAMSLFAGRKGKLHKMVMPFGIITFSLLVFSLIINIMQGSSTIVSAAIGTFIAAIYLIGAICLFVTSEKTTKKQK